MPGTIEYKIRRQWHLRSEFSKSELKPFWESNKSVNSPKYNKKVDCSTFSLILNEESCTLTEVVRNGLNMGQIDNNNIRTLLLTGLL